MIDKDTLIEQLHQLRIDIMKSGRHVDRLFSEQNLPLISVSPTPWIPVYQKTYDEFRSAYAQLLHLCSLLSGVPPDMLSVQSVTEKIFEETYKKGEK